MTRNVVRLIMYNGASINLKLKVVAWGRCCGGQLFSPRRDPGVWNVIKNAYNHKKHKD